MANRWREQDDYQPPVKKKPDYDTASQMQNAAYADPYGSGEDAVEWSGVMPPSGVEPEPVTWRSKPAKTPTLAERQQMLEDEPVRYQPNYDAQYRQLPDTQRYTPAPVGDPYGATSARQMPSFEDQYGSSYSDLLDNPNRRTGWTSPDITLGETMKDPYWNYRRVISELANGAMGRGSPTFGLQGPQQAPLPTPKPGTVNAKTGKVSGGGGRSGGGGGGYSGGGSAPRWYGELTGKMTSWRIGESDAG